MPGVIDGQLDSLQLSVQESGPVPAPHELSSASREFEDLLAVAIALYERLSMAVSRWQASVTEWESAAWIEQARHYETRYRRLKETFDRIDRLLTEWEAEGLRPEGAAPFREASIDLDVLCQLSVDRMAKADQSFRQGRGRTTAEVRDELRRRMGGLRQKGISRSSRRSSAVTCSTRSTGSLPTR